MIGFALVLLATAASPSAADTTERRGPIARGTDSEGQVLLGKPAPGLPVLPWLDGQARSNRSLAGKVVVLRNFTDGCPFCQSTIPALDKLHRDYDGRGVVVLGVYHPKPPRPVTPDEARGHARALGASFPVAVDAEWKLVNDWWLRHGNHWTSVTWVLDRRGRVRLVHPGGEYHPGGGANHAQCRDDEQALRALLDTLLRE